MDATGPHATEATGMGPEADMAMETEAKVVQLGDHDPAVPAPDAAVDQTAGAEMVVEPVKRIAAIAAADASSENPNCRETSCSTNEPSVTDRIVNRFNAIQRNVSHTSTKHVSRANTHNASGNLEKRKNESCDSTFSVTVRSSTHRRSVREWQSTCTGSESTPSTIFSTQTPKR